MGKRRFNAVARVVRQGQTDGAGWRDRSMVTVACTVLSNLIGKFIRKLLHITTVFRHQDRPSNTVTILITIGFHFRSFGQNFFIDCKLVLHNRGGSLFYSELNSGLPTDLSHFT